MRKKIYNKLVRDKIPDIIQMQGSIPIIQTLNDREFTKALYKKLWEEVEEFLSDYNVEELVDVYEVLLAILHAHNISLDEFEEMCNKKSQEKGVFEKKIFLISVDE